MNVAFFGATRGMGRALARLMALRGDDLCLLGRRDEDLERSCADLAARGGGEVTWVSNCDLLDRKSFGPSLDRALELLGSIDTIVVTAAVFADQHDLESDEEQRDQLLVADFVNTIHFCEAARARLLAGGGGTLCVFSSVAGERARKFIFLYGAAKAGLSYYLEGLDHRFKAQGLHTVCVKPGFVRTGMTAHLDPPPFAGEPDAVARTVLRAIDRRRPIVYAPPVWALIMLLIRSLPRAVMRRIGF